MEKQIKSVETHILFKLWLIVLIGIGIFKVLSIASTTEAFLKSFPEPVTNNYKIYALVSNLLIVICFVMLYRLKKWAFWGVVIISIIAIAMNISVGFSILRSSLFIVCAFTILFGVMQLKKNNISAWQALN